MDSRVQFWRRWLAAVAWVLLAFGSGMVLLPATVRRLFGLLLFGSGEGAGSFGGVADAYITFVYAVLGATMMGWAVAMLLALAGPYRRGHREGWLMVAVPLAAWFVPDTAASLYYGFWPNAALNAVLALVAAVPLAATYRAMTSDGADLSAELPPRDA